MQTESTGDGGSIYRIPERTRKLLIGMLLFQPVIVLAAGVYIGLTVHRPGILLLMGCAVLFSLVGTGMMIGTAMTSATVLYPDRIEARSLFGRRVLNKTDVASQTLVKGQQRGFIELKPRASGVRPLRVPNYPDETYTRWFQSIPQRGG
jgi:hypothetical protein